MKKLQLMKRLFPFLSLLAFILWACSSDDSLFTYPSDPDNPNTEKGEEYATGGIYATEEDWKDIPVLTDLSQLNLGDVSNSKFLNNKILASYRGVDSIPPPLFNQNPYGTCTSSAIAYGVAILSKKLTGMNYDNIELYSSDTKARTFSVAFLHRMAHLKSIGDISKEGRKIPEVLNALYEHGAPTLADYPYELNNINSFPSDKIKKKASFSSFNIFRINTSVSQTKEQIKGAIDLGTPVFFSMIFPKLRKAGTHDKFEPYLRGGSILGKNELLADKAKANFVSYGYHTMTIIGYDDNAGGPGVGAFMVLNSWGDDWGGKDGASIGCFWLKYDAVGEKYPNNTLMITDYGTLGLKDDAKIASSSILYEFSGFEKYKNVTYSNNLANFDMKEIGGTLTPYLKLDKKDFIEYPRAVVPYQGTIEIDVFINKDSFYQEVYNSLTQSLISSTSTTSVPLFSTLIDTQSESAVSQAGISTGAMELRVNADGSVRVRAAIKKFDEALEEMKNSPSASGTNLRTFIAEGKFDFNKWNTIGLSIGSEGLKIRVNSTETATNHIYSLTANHRDTSNKKDKPFTIGYGTARNDRWSYTAGNVVVSGTNKLYKEGFTGYIRAFRTSKKQSDWVISKK